MYFPLSISDLSLFLAVATLILLITSELIMTASDFSSTMLNKKLLRTVAIGCGAAFGVTVAMRIAQMG
jgi:VIT1/CCC1 family predicted Fe2+/Mn2+ transporter